MFQNPRVTVRSHMPYTRQQLAAKATLTEPELAEADRCRGEHNKLGFGYQLGFVKLTGRLPFQEAPERIEELLLFIAAQLGSSAELFAEYQRHQGTVRRHQARIRQHLNVRRLDESDLEGVASFIFEQACHLEHSSALLAKAKEHLGRQRILLPANSTLVRLVGEQRERARQMIFGRIVEGLPDSVAAKLDELLVVGDDDAVSLFERLKENPSRPSAAAMLSLLDRLAVLRDFGLFEIDLSWLSARYQRGLFHWAHTLTADRIRLLADSRRYATLVCFLWQSYAETLDQAIDMFDKLLARTAAQAQTELEERLVRKQKLMRQSVNALHAISHVMLDETVDDAELRTALLEKVSAEQFSGYAEDLSEWATGKSRDPFLGITRRYTTLRKFAPAFLKAIRFDAAGDLPVPSLDALAVLKDLNANSRRKLPDGVSTEFASPKLRPFVAPDGNPDRRAWECALLMQLREDVRSGNISVEGSRRFGPVDDFFMPQDQWEAYRTRFFERAKLPSDPARVHDDLKRRLGAAYDRFLSTADSNKFAQADEEGWHLSKDKTVRPDDERLARLRAWLRSRTRRIKLPELLIEVDNELGFTQHFFAAVGRQDPSPDDVRITLAAVMAQGCNLGLPTMSELIEGVSYKQLKRASDSQLTEETQRGALAAVANAISSLEASSHWGDGRSSASDGQRFALPRKVLQQTYSAKFSDFALEFYSFVADNYAPFFSMPIECPDRDAAFILDGLLYNETELQLEEHYTDTHGYTEINFGAFAMLGRRFCPRIKGVQNQRIYKIDPARDYGCLESLVSSRRQTLDVRRIVEQWDRLAHLCASMETGHATASIVLKRLAGFSAKNRLYRAAREFGRAYKTEFVLEYMSEPDLRSRVRRGLLKVEQLHALSRDVFYGRRGKINARELRTQKNSCSCLTLIVACIIYWQAKEMSAALRLGDPEADGVDISMLKHISPIEWSNVVLYGQYVIDRRRIRRRRPQVRHHAPTAL